MVTEAAVDFKLRLGVTPRGKSQGSKMFCKEEEILVRKKEGLNVKAIRSKNVSMSNEKEKKKEWPKIQRFQQRKKSELGKTDPN